MWLERIVLLKEYSWYKSLLRLDKLEKQKLATMVNLNGNCAEISVSEKDPETKNIETILVKAETTVNTTFTKEKDKGKGDVDIPELILLLQSLGFCLNKFDIEEECPKPETESSKKIEVKLEISCAKSGMKAVLMKPLENCKCPTKDIVGKAEFWNISGCANLENVTTTNSSLIPDLTQTQKKVLVNLMDRAIHVINKSDSKNEDLPCKPRFSSESDRSLLSLGSPPQSSSSPINDADSIAAYPFKKTVDNISENNAALENILKIANNALERRSNTEKSVKGPNKKPLSKSSTISKTKDTLKQGTPTRLSVPSSNRSNLVKTNTSLRSPVVKNTPEMKKNATPNQSSARKGLNRTSFPLKPNESIGKLNNSGVRSRIPSISKK